MKRTVAWLAQAAGAILILLGAIATEVAASHRSQRGMFTATMPSQVGLYGPEYSTTLPVATGATSRMFHWTYPLSVWKLWPASAGNTVLELEYLTPHAAEHVLVDIGEAAHIALPPTASLRVLHLALPASNSMTIRLAQPSPADVDGRRLGLLVSNVRWHSVGSVASAIRSSWRVLRGLPLTVVLLAGFLLSLRLRNIPTLLVASLALLAMALATIRGPWDVRAMQPVLQALLIYALVGSIMSARVRWFRIHRWSWIIVLAWGLSSLIFFGPRISHDGAEYYAYLRSLLIDGDLRFGNELDPAQSPFQGTPDLASLSTVTGYTPNLASVGPAMAWTPFWLLAHGVTLLGRASGLAWQADGYAPPYIVLVALASALAGLATMLGCFVVARRWFDPSTAALGAITVYFGSNVLFYAQMEGSFAHSVSSAAATWLVVTTLALDDAPTWRRWLLLGLAAGALIVTYWITALLLIIPAMVGLRHVAICIGRRDWRGLGMLVAGALLAAASALAVFAPQMLVWKILEGGWLAMPRGGASATPQNIKLTRVVVSSLYGMLWWTPGYAIGLLGLIGFAIRRPWPGATLLTGLALYLLYNASLGDWDGGGAFGLRRLTPLAPLCGVGLAAIFHGLQRLPGLAASLAALTIGWCLQMMARYLTYELPHEPYMLEDMGLRALLFRPEPFPMEAFVLVARDGWFVSALRAPGLGDLLIVGACLLTTLLVLITWRQLAGGRNVVVLPGGSARARQ